MSASVVVGSSGRDTISLVGLRARGRHGVLPEETVLGQEFVVDLHLAVSTAPAATSDDLRLTVDYGSLAAEVVALVEGEPVALIETLAQRVADRALTRARVAAVEVVVHKPQAPVQVPFADVVVRISRSRSERPVVLALGSNLGDRLAHLRAGVAGLAQTGLEIVAVSDVIETAPVGGPDQGAYLNAVALVRTGWPLPEVLAAAHRVEASEQRTREVRWGARTLDIDVIAAGTESLEAPDITVPHPRAHQRSFVLLPWLQLEPEAVLPQGSVADLTAALGDEGILGRQPFPVQP